MPPFCERHERYYGSHDCAAMDEEARQLEAEKARAIRARQIAMSTPLPALWALGVSFTDALMAEVVAFGTAVATTALAEKEQSA